MKPSGNMVKMLVEPEPLEVDLGRSAVVVVDMQNAFLKKGGLLDLAGLDISQASKVITAARETLSVARKAGLPIIYIQMGYPPDMSTAGGHQSPNPCKELALCLMRGRPELKGRLLIWGTWDADIIEEIAPVPGDIIVRKSRYNGFANTNLDEVLRTRSIKTLFFMGVATNVCVESTIRDAFFHEYWPVLISDATMQAGPPEIQEASLFNIKTFFGWVTSSDDFKKSLAVGM
jgi:ureidoacrylate peracid hydrolase